jgi:hypothetical protein
LESKYPGPEGPALVAPKGLLFNSHWHLAEHPEMGPKEFELFERSEFSNSRQISGRARCPKGRVTRVPFLLEFSPQTFFLSGSVCRFDESDLFATHRTLEMLRIAIVFVDFQPEMTYGLCVSNQ